MLEAQKTDSKKHTLTYEGDAGIRIHFDWHFWLWGFQLFHSLRRLKGDWGSKLSFQADFFYLTPFESKLMLIIITSQSSSTKEGFFFLNSFRARNLKPPSSTFSFSPQAGQFSLNLDVENLQIVPTSNQGWTTLNLDPIRKRNFSIA
jgi:hypothetical protein